MANLIGAGLEGGAVPPPIEYYVQDNFEGGILAPEWTYIYNVESKTWAQLGITGPLGGGAYGGHIPVTGSLYIDIPETDTLWITSWVRIPAAGEQAVYIGQTLNEGVNLQRLRIIPNSWLFCKNEADGISYNIESNFTAEAWYKIKVHLYLHDTAGIIQIWYDAGAGWVLGVDESGIDTLYNDRLIERVQAMSFSTRSPNYYDEYNVLKADPSPALHF